MDQDTIFALDIGTRKITGLLMQCKAGKYEVLGSEMIEHSTRAMLDGQIHDVEAVAAVIREIKERLEDRFDVKLESAAVAAAGRALKTAHGQARRQRSYASEISLDEVRALEIEAVQQAQFALVRNENNLNKASYFCVGYSVSQYQLEDQLIGKLAGQVGHSMGVEVVATFLPRVVVDSLFSALKRANLSVYSMTLEPIAALAVAIPPNMRLLNLALLDVGAGTSDMAIVKDGSIFAYAMVPVGGDEITEVLASAYLMDFNSAEELKCSLTKQDQVSFVDILGNESHMPSSELVKQTDGIVQDLAGQVSKIILELNGKAPDAVICIGGGSLSPGLSGAISSFLEIPSNRVGIRTHEGFKLITGDFANLEGPQGVTTLGIAYHCFENPPLPFFKVWVNDREVAIWNMGEMDIASALLSSGISLNNMYGKPGMGKTIDINGYLKVFKGEMGTAPIIRLNGKDTSLETPVQDGDRIVFEKGKDGQDAVVSPEKLIPAASGYIAVNGEQVQLSPQVKVNGEIWEQTKEIPDRARVEIERANRIDDVLRIVGVADSLLQEKVYQYWLNDQAMVLRWTPVQVKVDGQAVNLDQTVRFGASLEYKIVREHPHLSDVLKPETGQGECVVTVNGETVCLQHKGVYVTRNGQAVDIEEELYNGMRLMADDNSKLILSDIFNSIDIKPPVNKRLIMTVDGQEAGFTTPIKHGSVIELGWE